jgi:GPH family glycoside/pentoside/hexuronide:cation symporter
MRLKMLNQTHIDTQRCSTPEMVKYSLGACSESLIVNSFTAFAMLYYTKALGLSPEYFGSAIFLAIIWDAVTDPIMGHVTDNTRSRFGKRHPYILFGGMMMLACYFFIWYVPEFFKSSMLLLFWYLLAINLLLRTTSTIFVVPYTALGFDMCSDYADRSKIQGIRNSLNMAANLFGCAMAWTIFFGDSTDTVPAINVKQNYIAMGTTFTIISFLFLFLMLALTKKYMRDSRRDEHCSSDVAAFFRDFKQIVLDKYAQCVFLFVFVLLLGIVLVSSFQMYVFEDFMRFRGWEKTLAHGATMLGMGIGYLFGSTLVRRFDKKKAICIGLCWSVLCEVVLALFFLTGFVKPGQTIGGFPAALALYSFLHGAYWFGNGVVMTITVSMMADISEIHRIASGVNKNGSYAAMYSFSTQVAIAFGILLSGYSLKWVGFVSGPDAVSGPEVIRRIFAMAHLLGPLVSLMAMGLILKYPVNKAFIELLRGKQQKC